MGQRGVPGDADLPLVQGRDQCSVVGIKDIIDGQAIAIKVAAHAFEDRNSAGRVGDGTDADDPAGFSLEPKEPAGQSPPITIRGAMSKAPSAATLNSRFRMVNSPGTETEMRPYSSWDRRRSNARTSD